MFVLLEEYEDIVGTALVRTCFLLGFNTRH